MLTVQDNADVQAAVNSDELDSLFAQAVIHHQAQEWQAAEDCYQKVLVNMPEQPNANYNLGMLKLQLDQIKASVRFFRNALAADANEPKYWVSYIQALMLTNDKKQAADVLLQGLEHGLHGDEVDVLVNTLTASEPPVSSATGSVIVNEAVIINGAVPTSLKQTSATSKSVQIVVNAEQSSTTSSLQPYLNNPQVNKLLALQQAGDIKRAKKLGAKLLKLLPKHPILLTCLGGIALSEERIDDGITLLKTSLSIVSTQTTALSYLCIAYTQVEKFELAIECADKAITLNPNYVEAHINRASALKYLGRYDEAIIAYKKVIALMPDSPYIYLELGSIQVELMQYQEAAVYLKQATQLSPESAKAHCLYGKALQSLNQHGAALQCFDVAIKLDCNQQDVWLCRGITKLSLKQYELAAIDFEHVTQLDANNSDAYYSLGNVYRKIGQFEQALASYNTAIQLVKTNADYYNNKGLLLGDMQRFDEAFDCFEQAIATDHDCAKAYWNKALLHLLLGDFTQGWQQYESRWSATLRTAYRAFSKPLWLGEQSLQGKTLLIYPEQGFGDYIQFCRYVTEVEQLGARVILEVEKPLLSLVSTLQSECTIIEAGNTLPEFDYHCPIMSLPLALKTQLTSIPADIPYIYADESKVSNWRQQLGAKAQPRVGLVWSGSVTHDNDYQRSLPLAMCRPLFSLPLAFHALQNEIRATDMAILTDINTLRTHEQTLQDFSDTAALIAHMDLVITVDTAVAHVAGAMGKPCWLLLPYSVDFRWLVDREDSPWYPSMTLFRQAKLLDWADVIDKVKMKLQQELVKL